jgi:hypothetical protein
MYSDIELKAFEIIDKFLQLLVDKGSGSVYNIGKDFYSTESQIAYKIMCDRDLIHFRKGYQDTDSVIDITQNGLYILKIDGYKKYLDTLQQQSDHDNYVKNLEIEKTVTDLKLAKKMLKEYPYTKWFARIGFAIAIGLGLLELIRFLKGR